MVIADNRSVEISNRRAKDVFYNRRRPFDESAGGNIYYPYWRALANGRAVEVDKDENGELAPLISAREL